MNIGVLFADEDAVSPVIGVILMVAITVILAAVIGAFVLNIGGSQDNAPQATIEFTFKEPGSNNNYVEMSHQGGDPLKAGDVDVKIPQVSGTTSGAIPSEMTAGDTFYVGVDGSNNVKVAGSYTAGSTFSNDVTSSMEISVVWNSPNSDKTSVLATFSPA